MSEIDGANLPGPGNTDVSLVVDRTFVVRIVADGGGAVGNLFSVTDEGSGIKRVAAELGKEYRAR
jgi:hypothetical protein